MDTAKAIAALTVLPGKLADYAGKEIKGNFPPLVLIPTAAGTGSEATKYLVFTDTATQEKLLLKSDNFLPQIAVTPFPHPDYKRNPPETPVIFWKFQTDFLPAATF